MHSSGTNVFEISFPALTPTDVKPEEIPLDIVYEDEDVVVVNKPAGLVVHPGAGNWEHTVWRNIRRSNRSTSILRQAL